MPVSGMTMKRAIEICARLIKRESQSSIRRATGAAASTITKAIAELRRWGVEIETLPPTPRNEQHASRLEHLFATTSLSNREIARQLGKNADKVSLARKRYNERLVLAGGELPRCRCGQYLHHPRLCWARHHDSLNARGIRSVRTLPAEQQADVRQHLLEGEVVRIVAERVFLPTKTVRSFLRSFSPDERRVRDDAFRVAAGRRRALGLSKSIQRPKATRPEADPLYAQIARLVSHRLDPALRDDIISETYLAVLDGRAKVERLAEAVKKARSKVFGAFANPWGDRSLDQCGDNGRSLTDTLADDRALAAFA